MENLVWLIENFIYGDISAENDDNLRRAFAARAEFNALHARLAEVEAQRDVAKLALKNIASIKTTARELKSPWCPGAGDAVRIAKNALAKLEVHDGSLAAVDALIGGQNDTRRNA